jgi:ATP-dependent DNA helicase DinG
VKHLSNKNTNSHANASSKELLGELGPFACVDHQFQPRTGQQDMAGYIEQVLSGRDNIAIEAPSGSGKTLGYLVPALRSQKKIIVSTATHALQQQLVQRDVPYTAQTLGITVNPVLLKGRQNYLCPDHLEKNLSKGQFKQAQTQTALTVVAQRFRETHKGDLSVIAVDIATELLPKITSSQEECAGESCRYYSQCPFYQQRNQALNAEIVVINHHLLVSDFMSELLVDDAVVIVDEAHRLVEISQSLTSHAVNSYQLYRFVHSAQQALLEHAPEYQKVLVYLQQFESLISGWRKQLPLSPDYQAERHRHLTVVLQQWIEKLLPWLQSQKTRSGRFRQLIDRADTLVKALQSMRDEEVLCLAENRGKGFVVQSIPPSFANVVTGVVSSVNWVFTSATFSVAGDASQALRLLGLTEQQYRQVGSQLNYQHRALLYTPALSLLPDESGYYPEFVAFTAPLLRALPGRALLLFSSYKALQQVAGLLRGEKACEKTILVQGEESNGCRARKAMLS